ncbi:hypothetical protein Tco_0450766 [Tanacetum coccineum]
MSFDDLYNNFKVVKQEVKGTANSSSSYSSQNMAFVSSPNSTNEVNTAYGVSTTNSQVSPASTQVSTASTHDSTANLSDATVYAFLASQPNGSHLIHEDFEQIHENNLEEMDLNYMADDEVPTNMALIAFSDSEFNKSEFNLATYKRGLASVEEQLVFYKKNELEKIKQENKSIQLKIENIDNASKSLDKLIRSQITDKSRKGVGFPEFEGYGPKTSKTVSEYISNEVKESPVAPLVEMLVLKDKLEKNCHKANCNYHQRERMVSGNNYTRVNYNYFAKQAHPSTHKNMAPRAILMKTGLRPLNIARPVNTAHPKIAVYSARPMSHFSKSA